MIHCFRCRLVIALCGFALMGVVALAQVPQIISYQGRVAVNAVNFNAAGQFKFALVNADGTVTFWSNDGSSLAGSAPVAAVTLPVTDGLYSVLLGDGTLTNMTAIPGSVFAHADVRLRVWFNDGADGWQLLAPDQRIAAVGYAMMAATVPDGSITSAQLAPGAVTAANIAPGSITGTQLANGTIATAQLAPQAVQALNIADGVISTTQLADGSVGSAQLAPQAVQASNIANGAIGNAQLADGSVGAAQLAPGAVILPTTLTGINGIISTTGSDLTLAPFDTTGNVYMPVHNGGLFINANTIPQSALSDLGSPFGGIYLVGPDSGSGAIIMDNYGHGGGVFFGRRAQGTAASPSGVIHGQTLATMLGAGYGKTGFGPVTGQVLIAAAEDFTDTAQGTLFQILLTPAGTLAPKPLLTMQGGGAIVVSGGVNPSLTLQGNTAFLSISPTRTDTSGNASTATLQDVYQQTGTAGSTDLLIQRVESGLGSGPQNFLQFQSASTLGGLGTGAAKFTVDHNGTVAAGNLSVAGNINGFTWPTVAGANATPYLISGNIDLTAPGNITVYTPPAGKEFIVTSIVIENVIVTSVTAPAQVVFSAGATAGSVTTAMSLAAPSVGQVFNQTIASQPFICTNSAPLVLQPTVPATAAAYTVKVWVSGMQR